MKEKNQNPANQQQKPNQTNTEIKTHQKRIFVAYLK